MHKHKTAEQRRRATEELHRRQYAGVSDAEVERLGKLYGPMIHEFPGMVLALIDEVRTRH